MTFNANEFRSHLAKVGGSAQDNYFEVVFALPAIAKFSTNVWEENADTTLKFRAHVSDMPARNLETIDRRYAGPMRNVPVGHTYTTLQLQFIEANDRKTRKIFDAWQAYIMDDKGGWSVPYYKDIVAEYIELRLFNKDKATPSAVYRFYEAFPVTIGASQLSWQSKNQIISIPIEMAFHRWENLQVEPVTTGQFGALLGRKDSPSSIFDGIRNGIKTFRDVVKTVNEVKTTVNTVKSQINEAKRLANEIKRTTKNLSFKNLNSAAESLSKLERLGERSVSQAERAYRSPIFKSVQVKLPNIIRKFDK